MSGPRSTDKVTWDGLGDRSVDDMKAPTDKEQKHHLDKDTE